MPPFGSESPQLLKGHRRAALGPKAIRARQKIRLEDRLQHQLRRHLNHPVPHRRNAQRPPLPISLRYVPPLDHLRSVLARLQLGAQFFQELLDSVLLDVTDGLAIPPGRATVTPHSPPRLLKNVTSP